MDYITSGRGAGMEAKEKYDADSAGRCAGHQRRPNRCMTLVGPKPQTSVKEGVKNFVEWYKVTIKI